nr:RNA demethylase ALKBH5-like [Ipomoea batatas]
MSLLDDSEAASEEATAAACPQELHRRYLNRWKKDVPIPSSPGVGKSPIKPGDILRVTDKGYRQEGEDEEANQIRGKLKRKRKACLTTREWMGKKADGQNAISFDREFEDCLVLAENCSGPVSIPSAKAEMELMLAKHALPVFHPKRISVTFRKMDESKSPLNYKRRPLSFLKNSAFWFIPLSSKLENRQLSKVLLRMKRSIKHDKTRFSTAAQDKKNQNVLHWKRRNSLLSGAQLFSKTGVPEDLT